MVRAHTPWPMILKVTTTNAPSVPAGHSSGSIMVVAGTRVRPAGPWSCAGPGAVVFDAIGPAK